MSSSVVSLLNDSTCPAAGHRITWTPGRAVPCLPRRRRLCAERGLEGARFGVRCLKRGCMTARRSGCSRRAAPPRAQKVRKSLLGPMQKPVCGRRRSMLRRGRRDVRLTHISRSADPVRRRVPRWQCQPGAREPAVSLPCGEWERRGPGTPKPNPHQPLAWGPYQVADFGQYRRLALSTLGCNSNRQACTPRHVAGPQRTAPEAPKVLCSASGMRTAPCARLFETRRRAAPQPATNRAPRISHLRARSR